MERVGTRRVVVEGEGWRVYRLGAVCGLLVWSRGIRVVVGSGARAMAAFEKQNKAQVYFGFQFAPYRTKHCVNFEKNWVH